MAEMKNKEDKAKSELEEVVASKTELARSSQSRLTSMKEANEVIAGYKMKEEEMAKKDDAGVKKKSQFIEAGLSDDAASLLLRNLKVLMTKLLNLNLLEAMKQPKEEEKAKKRS